MVLMYKMIEINMSMQKINCNIPYNIISLKDIILDLYNLITDKIPNIPVKIIERQSNNINNSVICIVNIVIIQISPVINITK